MSTDTERLEREAEARRSSVNSTIDELRNRMSPGQILDEVTDYFGKGQTNAAVQNLGRQVRDNPLALGLVGAGLAWLLLGKGVRDNLPNTGRRAYSDDDREYRGASATYPRGDGGDRYGSVGSEGADDTSPGLGERASSVASGAAESVSGAASSVASSLSGAASSVASGMSDAASGVRRSVHDAQHSVAGGARSVGDSAYRGGMRARRGLLDTLQEEPLVFGAIALAVGAAIGASLPSTDVEDAYLGETGDRLRDQAREYGKQAVETAKGVATDTYAAASEEAERQGLTVGQDGDTLASKVSNVVGAATEAAKNRADAGRDG